MSRRLLYKLCKSHVLEGRIMGQLHKYYYFRLKMTVMKYYYILGSNSFDSFFPIMLSRVPVYIPIKLLQAFLEISLAESSSVT
jgi:hypothetical protein